MRTPIPLPLELLDAHDEGRLVLFCGAGISRHTGLADFRQLTLDAFKACGLPIDENGQDFPEDLAVRNGQYDRALHLLENQSPAMRREVQALLRKRPRPGSLETHKALLTLSAGPGGGHRLVTTNFDNRFELAADKTLRWQTAPSLEPPRGEQWQQLTYLHGRIDPIKDPEGRHLVLTSADFARAYLQDGWAAQFTQRLFENYVVLFVGYSLNDPVIGYLIDGMAADLRTRGGKLQAFILADDNGSPEDRKRNEAIWEARGLRPVCFCRSENFSALHRTLQAWAAYHTKGIQGRIDHALSMGCVAYDPELHSNADVDFLAWALSKADGSVARAFAEADPLPDISWLAPLSTSNIPAPDGNGTVNLFAMPAPPPHGANRYYGELAGRAPLIPDTSAVTFQLGRWLTRHLDKQQLVDWVIERRGLVHPAWAFHIERSLCGQAEPWQTFWRLILDGATQLHEHAMPIWPISLDKGEWPDGMDAAFLNAARCRVVPQKSWQFLSEQNQPPQHLFHIARFELAVTNPDLLSDIWEKRGEKPVRDALMRLADSLTSRLAEGWAMLQRADTGMYMLDVGTPLTQPDGFGSRDYSHLVALCMEAFAVLRRETPTKAAALAGRWLSLWRDDRVYLFRRMALHALAHVRAVPADQELSLLMDGRAEMLWSGDCGTELGEYLRLRAPHLPSPILDDLIAAIVAGPADDTGPYATRWSIVQIAQRLAKLKEGGASLPEWLPNIADEYVSDLEEPPERSFTGRRAASEPDISLRPPEEMAAQLAADADSYRSSEQFYRLCANAPLTALAVTSHLSRLLDRPWGGWDGLFQLAEKQESTTQATIVRELLAICRDHDAWLDYRPLLALARLLAGVAGALPQDRDKRAEFLALWQLLWGKATEHSASTPQKPDDTVRDVFDSPCGKLADALLTVITNAPGKSIPRDTAPLFKVMIGGKAAHSCHARIVAASYLPWLHQRARTWVKTDLLPRMRYGQAEAAHLWLGFFRRPILPLAMMRDMQEALVSMAGQWGQGDHARIGNQCIALTLIQSPCPMCPENIGQVMRRANGEDLAHMGWFLADQMKKDPSLWRKRIRSIIADYWPSSIAKATPKATNALVRIAFQAGDAFADAIGLMDRRALLAPVEDSALRLYRLKKAEDGEESYVATAPAAVLTMLSAILPVEISPWHAREVEDLLNRLCAQSPALADDPRMVRLRRMILQKG